MVKMKIPEYPAGREVVFTANDVTMQSGSFCVPEDDLYYKASKFACKNQLPRVYLACNAGAKISLVDNLQPKIKIKLFDKNALQKVFEYLYLSLCHRQDFFTTAMMRTETDA